VKTFFAILFLLPFLLTLFTWSQYGFRFSGGEGPGVASGLFLVVGLPCGIISALSFRSRNRS
jgi:hypothetical protein